MICGLLLRPTPGASDSIGISCHISGEQVSGLAYPESLGCLGTYFEAAGYQTVALRCPVIASRRSIGRFSNSGLKANPQLFLHNFYTGQKRPFFA